MRSLRSLLDRSRQSIKDGKGMSEDDFWKVVRQRAEERKSHNKPRGAKRRQK